MLQLRISLRGVSPPVWRRLLIPEEITIADLQHVMQLAMGWNDEHVHQFMSRGWRYGGHREGALQCFDGPDTLSLAAFGLHEHERFAYVYDFTAWWLHDVRVDVDESVQKLGRRISSGIPSLQQYVLSIGGSLPTLTRCTRRNPCRQS
jgi:hypothetical protein